MKVSRLLVFVLGSSLLAVTGCRGKDRASPGDSEDGEVATDVSDTRIDGRDGGGGPSDGGETSGDTGETGEIDGSSDLQVRNVRLESSSGDADGDLSLSFDTGGGVLTAVTDWQVDGESIAGHLLPFDRLASQTSPDYAEKSRDCSAPDESATPGPEGGRVGRAHVFDGTDDELVCPSGVDFGRPFGFEMWVRPSGTAQQSANAGVAAAVDDRQEWSWQLRYGSPDGGHLGVKFHPEQGEPLWLSAGQAMEGGRWHHLAVTHDGSTVRMYLDGTEVDSAAASRLVAVDQLTIGQDGWDQYFAGRLDGARVYRRALSADQIRAFYRAGRQGREGRTLVAAELRPGETWRACVTPSAEAGDGETVCSNRVELPPSETGPPDDASDVTKLGIRGDGSDETDAIQALLDKADPGDAFYFPATDAFYGIGKPGLTLNKPVRLYGDGWETGGAGRHRDSVGTFSTSVLRNVDAGSWSGVMVNIETDDVLIDGLRFSGESYVGNAMSDGRLVRVLGADATSGDRYQNITIRNSWLEGAERVLWFERVEDFIVDNTHVQEGVYSLIFIKLSKRGMIRRTNYWDSGDPPVGGRAWSGGNNPTGDGYGLVVTTPRDQPDRSEDMLLYDNWGRDIALWFADHNHGCDQYLSFNNLVETSRYAFSGSSFNTADYGQIYNQWYLNNTALDTRLESSLDLSPTGFAFTAGHYLDGFYTIGNIARRTDGKTHRSATFRAKGRYGGLGGVYTWNEIHGPAETPHLKAINNPTMVAAHNTIDGDPMQVSGSYDDTASQYAAPQPPTDLQAAPTAEGVELTWRYPESETHDSFYVEWSADGSSSWQRVAFTPPNNGIFDFDAPTNPHWEPYDPLRWVDRDHRDGFYRIRANNGDKTSDWSDVAEVE